jgi:SET domain-containing protein
VCYNYGYDDYIDVVFEIVKLYISALVKISKGQFVAEYVGEVIKTMEAKERQKIYDQKGLNYLLVIILNE